MRLEWYEFASCCGLGEVWNFDNHYIDEEDGYDLDSIAEETAQLKAMSSLRGAFICALTEYQARDIEKTMLKAGWKRLMIGIRNPNTGNLLTIYGLRTAPSEKDKWLK